MRNWHHISIAFLIGITSNTLLAAPKIGTTPKSVELKGELGGLVSGDPWKSNTLSGKVHAVFYVDPDEKDANEGLKKALHKAAFSEKEYQSTVVINMDATIIPNFILSGIIEGSQEENPRAVYVKDLDKVLVKEWQLKDDAFHVLILSKSGKVVFEQAGSLDAKQVNDVVALIRSEIRK